jgi:hypothetical protein
MKVMVVHDEQGNIRHLAVPAKEFDGKIQLRPQSGRLVTEVELERVTEDPLDEGTLQYLETVVRESRIELDSQGGRLVPKVK